jgi:hypothetical protein
MRKMIGVMGQVLAARNRGHLALFLLFPLAVGLAIGFNTRSRIEGLAAAGSAVALVLLMRCDWSPSRLRCKARYVLWGTFFGLGLGVVWGLAAGNMAFYGIGVGLGTSTGAAVGQLRR